MTDKEKANQALQHILKQIMHDSPTTYISLGGWCANTMAMKAEGYYEEALPFDYVKCTFEGIVHCLENNFSAYYPKNIELDDNIPGYKWNGQSYRGKYVSFYHHDIRTIDVKETFDRRIKRLQRMLKERKKIVFYRTVVSENYEDEVKFQEQFHRVMKEHFSPVNCILVLIVPDQEVTSYVKNVGGKTFIFTLKDKGWNVFNLGELYRPIFNFVNTNDLFINVPDPNPITIVNTPRIWYDHDAGGTPLPIMRPEN